MSSRVPVFISYASEDRVLVERIYLKLKAEGYRPWIDVEDILPGEDWEDAINRAIRSSEFFMPCLTPRSVGKLGFVQKEITDALGVWQAMERSRIYLIPVMIEECEVPDSLSQFQVVRLYEPEGWARLQRSFEEGARRRIDNGPREAEQKDGGVMLRNNRSHRLPAHSGSEDSPKMDIAVVEVGSTTCHYYKRVAPDSDNLQQDWDRIALDHALSAVNGAAKTYEVFFCLRGDYLVDRFDHVVIQPLVAMARERTWGAQVYVALRQDVWKAGLPIIWQERTAGWLNTAMRLGVDDVIEVNIHKDPEVSRDNRVLSEQHDGKHLSNGADLSRRRASVLALMSPQRGWKCVFPNSERHLQTFLHPYSARYLPLVLDHPCMIVVTSEYAQERYVLEALDRVNAARVAVATHRVDSKEKLTSICRERRIAILACKGPLELRYALMHLDRSPEQGSYESAKTVEIVPLSAGAPFLPSRSDTHLDVLVTSGFNPATEPGECLSAATQIGQLLRGLPPWVKRVVHPAAAPRLLTGLVEGGSDIGVWIYIGRCDSAHGLLEAASSSFISVDEWVEAIRRGPARLALGFFVSAHSAEAARHLAACGAQVAIGFDSDLPTTVSQFFSRVIEAAASYSGDRQRILSAFHVACTEIARKDYSEVVPVAYCSEG